MNRCLHFLLPRPDLNVTMTPQPIHGVIGFQDLVPSSGMVRSGCRLDSYDAFALQVQRDDIDESK